MARRCRLWGETPAGAFLERIAVQDPKDADFPASAPAALATLAVMDAEGRTVLKRLQESGAVRDPDARLDLATLAKHGYKFK